jgi:glucose-6-phosphate 1-dehydrogenase
MGTSQSDALVVYGVTGDLAHKMTFPALYAMVKRGVLNVPLVGVAFPKWSMERLHRRIEDSLKRAGGIDDKKAFKRLLVAAPICERRLQGSGNVRGNQESVGQSKAARILSGDSSRAFRNGDREPRQGGIG